MKSVVERQHFINQVEQILHVPGNYTGGILEMAIVIDCSLSKASVLEELKEYLVWLKRHSPVFSNVRLNLIFWTADDCITTEVTSISMLQLGRPLENMPRSESSEKSLASLMEYLKKFHARSKLILIMTVPERYPVSGRNITLNTPLPEDIASHMLSEARRLGEALQPFLHRKILFLTPPLQTPEQSE